MKVIYPWTLAMDQIFGFNGKVIYVSLSPRIVGHSSVVMQCGVVKVWVLAL